MEIAPLRRPGSWLANGKKAPADRHAHRRARVAAAEGAEGDTAIAAYPSADSSYCLKLRRGAESAHSVDDAVGAVNERSIKVADGSDVAVGAGSGECGADFG